MTESNVIVLRRFPTYDFVMFLSLSPRVASDLLDAHIRNQKRPRGFVMTDPRVDGSVAGSTFSFRRRESGFGGSVSPYVEGYFVPENEGTNVYVRVQIPRWWWLFDLFFLVLALGSFISSGSVSDFEMVPLFLVFLGALTVGPVWYEGAETEKLLRNVLADPRQSNSA